MDDEWVEVARGRDRSSALNLARASLEAHGLGLDDLTDDQIRFEHVSAVGPDDFWRIRVLASLVGARPSRDGGM